MLRLVSFAGLGAMIGLAWLMSSGKRRVRLRVVVGGLVLQLALAALVLGTGAGRKFFVDAGNAFTAFLGYVDAGSQFVFGERFTEFPFAFQVLPTIIFFSSFMSILYYLGIMQLAVRGLGWVVQRTLGTAGAESLAAAANIFLGQTEAPLAVRPYIARMTRSELMAIMVPGFGSTAGGVLAAYVKMGFDAGHLMMASVLSAPAGLLIAKVLEPETRAVADEGRIELNTENLGTNLLDAAVIGAGEGLKLALNVAAMLIAFMALLAAANALVGWVGDRVGQEWSLEAAMGYAFYPLAWAMGIERGDCFRAGELLGLRMATNEFVAYDRFAGWLAENRAVVSERTKVILTYALCGFCNFASIGIQIGGIGGMAPARRAELASLGLRAMLGGTLACLMTACMAGIFG